MILKNYKNILANKVEIIDNDNVVFWSQPDFSYKHRVHIYSNSNDEIGYIQYKVTSNQNGNIICYPNDNIADISELSCIKIDDLHIRILDKGSEIGNIEYLGDDIIISINNNDIIDMYILFIYTLLF